MTFLLTLSMRHEEREEREVLEIVKAMTSDKVLGLDGYSMVFFQACWDVLKDNIIKVFHDFHASGKFEKSLNVITFSRKEKEFSYLYFVPFGYICLNREGLN